MSNKLKIIIMKKEFKHDEKFIAFFNKIRNDLQNTNICAELRCNANIIRLRTKNKNKGYFQLNKEKIEFTEKL
jgi:hypothetical protein